MGKEIKNHKKLLALPVFGLAAIISTILIGSAPATYADDTADLDVVVNVNAVIAMGADNIDISMPAPSPNGSFASGTGRVGVVTNDTSGYSIYLTAKTTATTLDHETVSTAKVNSIASDQTISGATTKFATANTWGWSNNGTLYHPVLAAGSHHTASQTTLYRRTATAALTEDVSTLTVGVTGNSSLTAGEYTGTLLLTAIPNSSTTRIAQYDDTI